jgi:hypothetical protein
MNYSHSQNLFPALAALHAAQEEEHPHDTTAAANRPPPRPFITISRQAGAGGRSLADALAARLNELDPGELPWTVWDNELVERVAAEHHLQPSTVADLEDRPPTWLEEALGGLTLGRGRPDELTVYHRVAATIRALAEIGRVVIVGRGAAFVTRDVPGGIHVRLVAPEEHRIAQTASEMGLSDTAAAKWVRQIDRRRRAFYRRHWPDHPVIPENFTVTFNTAAARADQLVDSVVCLLADREPSDIHVAESAIT